VNVRIVSVPTWHARALRDFIKAEVSGPADCRAIIREDSGGLIVTVSVVREDDDGANRPTIELRDLRLQNGALPLEIKARLHSWFAIHGDCLSEANAKSAAAGDPRGAGTA